MESKDLSDDSASDSSDSESSQTEFEVEEILQRRGSGKVVDYLVAWKGYSAESNCWVPAENLAGATDALAKFYSTQLKPRKEKGPKALPLPVPRATGIPQLQRNIVVQIDLGTSRSAVDALLPVLPPESDSGLREAKQSNSTPDSRLHIHMCPPHLALLSLICLFVYHHAWRA